jgi:hypothetical protein
VAAARPLARSDVFVNVPFDSEYERLFLALIAGLTCLGLNPKCVLEITATNVRLRRLTELIARCPFSLHDLSRVQASRIGRFRIPRFNMPFELGLAAAISELADATEHQWSILETVRHRAWQSLSDVSGYDVAIHNGRAEGMFYVLLDIFGNLPQPPHPTIASMRSVYRELRRYGNGLPGIYSPNSFRQLVLTAKGAVTRLPADG